MKKIDGVKGVMLLVVRLEAVALLFARSGGTTLCSCIKSVADLGNTSCQWKRKNCKGII